MTNAVSSRVQQDIRLLAQALETGRDIEELFEQEVVSRLAEWDKLAHHDAPQVGVPFTGVIDLIKERARFHCSIDYGSGIDDLPIAQRFHEIPDSARAHLLDWQRDHDTCPL